MKYQVRVELSLSEYYDVTAVDTNEAISKATHLFYKYLDVFRSGSLNFQVREIKEKVEDNNA